MTTKLVEITDRSGGRKKEKFAFENCVGRQAGY